MITFLRGVLADSLPNRLMVDVQGVGYEVIVPLYGADAFGEAGAEVRVLTHLYIREQEQTLYGFRSVEERDLFRLLIDRVSGVGPKVAMGILSGMSAGDFKSAVVAGDLNAIAAIKGLGKKTAERIVLELKDKVGVAAAWEAAVASRQAGTDPLSRLGGDAVLALISLGYKQPEAQKAVRAVIEKAPADNPPEKTDEIIRAALRLLS